MKKTDKELEEMFDMSARQLDKWEDAFARGGMPGKSAGEIVIGRSLLSGEVLKPIAFKEPESV
jgi:hypothetical protein